MIVKSLTVDKRSCRRCLPCAVQVSYNPKRKKNWTHCYRPPKVRPSGGAFKDWMLSVSQPLDVKLKNSTLP